MISYDNKNRSVTVHKTLDSDKSYRHLRPTEQPQPVKHQSERDREKMSEHEPLLNSRGHGGYEDKSEMRMETGGFFEQTIRPCLGEFFGVTLFVFVGTMSVSGAGGILGIAIAHGLMIALLVAALGNVRWVDSLRLRYR